MENKILEHNCNRILVLILILIHLRPLYAQSIDVPVEIQYPLLLKILTFDRNFNKETHNELKIGILYQEEYGRSVNIRNELISIIQNGSFSSVNNVPVHYQAIIYKDASELALQIKSNKIDVLYVTPMRMIRINEISDCCKKLQVLTFSGVTEYIKAGLSVGITLKGDKPQIIINNKSAKSEGSDFDSRLLQISRIVE